MGFQRLVEAVARLRNVFRRMAEVRDDMCNKSCTMQKDSEADTADNEGDVVDWEQRNRG